MGVCIWSREGEKAPALPADTFKDVNDALKDVGTAPIMLKPPQEVVWTPFEADLD